MAASLLSFLSLPSWWSLSLPAIACLLSGLALLGCCATFLRLRAERRGAVKEPDGDPAVQEALTELAAQIGQLRLRLEEAEQRKGALSDWAAEPSSVNLNRRGQVLRLYRRGDSVAHIASALGQRDRPAAGALRRRAGDASLQCNGEQRSEAGVADQ